MCMVILLVFHRHGTLLITPYQKLCHQFSLSREGIKSVYIHIHLRDFSDRTLVKAV